MICSVVWIVGGLVCHLFGRSVGCLVCSLVVHVVMYFAWLGNRLSGQSVIWQVDWLVCGLVAGLHKRLGGPQGPSGLV